MRMTARSAEVGSGVERFDELDRHCVHPLQHVGGGDVAVIQHDQASRDLRADLGGQVVVAVGGHRPGQGVPGVSVGAVAGERTRAETGRGAGHAALVLRAYCSRDSATSWART